MDLWLILIIVIIGITLLVIAWFQCKNEKKQNIQLLQKKSKNENQIANDKNYPTDQNQRQLNTNDQKIILQKNQNNQKNEESSGFDQKKQVSTIEDQFAIHIYEKQNDQFETFQKLNNKAQFNIEQNAVEINQKNQLQLKEQVQQQNQIQIQISNEKHSDFIQQIPKQEKNDEIQFLQINVNKNENLQQNQENQIIKSQFQKIESGQEQDLLSIQLKNDSESDQILQVQENPNQLNNLILEVNNDNLDVILPIQSTNQIQNQNNKDMKLKQPIQSIQDQNQNISNNQQLQEQKNFIKILVEIIELFQNLTGQQSVQDQKDTLKKEFANQQTLISWQIQDELLKDPTKPIYSYFFNIFRKIMSQMFEGDEFQRFAQKEDQKIKQIIQSKNKLEQLNFTDEIKLNSLLEHQPSFPKSKQFIENLYKETSEKRALDIQYKPYVRNVEDFSELRKNYSLALAPGKELKNIYCDSFRPVRGDGNCFYTAFGFQFLKHLIIQYKQSEFENFVENCKEISLPMKIRLSQEKEIENEQIEKELLNEFLNRLIKLRMIENLDDRFEQFIKQFAAYEYQNDEIDGCLYGLSTIFLRNYSNYAVEFHELKEVLFDRINLLIWETECNSNEIVIDALSRKLKLHTTLIYFEERNFIPREYGDENNPKIILLIKPGHYNIGINSTYEEQLTFSKLKEMEEQILKQLDLIITECT